MAESRKNKFIIHGGILAMAGIIVRVIGMFYRIPLMNIIGSEGNGIYSVAYNIYNIMLVLSSYGLPMAVSKLISAKFVRKQYKNAGKIIRCSLVVSICTGGLAALILFFGANLIEKLYKGVDGLAIPLRVLAPTIFLVAVMGVLRGFFQGQGTMIPTAFSQLIEQVMNAVVSIIAAYVLMKTFAQSNNVSAYGAAGGTLGTAIGALSGLLFMIFLYMAYQQTFAKKQRKDTVSESLQDSQVYIMILATMVPIILGQTLYQISAVIDDAMFSNIMTKTNVSMNIKADLGNFACSYSMLISIPQGIASAMSASMLPSIVASYTKNNIAHVRNKITSTIKTNMMIAIPSFVGFVVIGKPIIELLFSGYDSTQGAMMLRIGAIAVVFYTLSTVTSSALQAIDEMRKPVKNSLISLVVHIVIVYLMLRWSRLGIYALVIGNASFPILIFVLNLRDLKRHIDFKLEYIQTFLIPFGCACIMGFFAWLTYTLMYMFTSANVISVLFTLVIAAITYFCPLLLCKKKKWI